MGRGRRFLLNNIHIMKKEGKCALAPEGRRSVELPPQEVLESMADRYITYGGEADVGKWKRGFTTEAINEIKRGQARRNIKINKETWDLALDVTGATVQINTTGTTKAQRIQFYTMEEEVELGAIPTEGLPNVGRIIAATSADTAGSMIRTMEGHLKKDPSAWAILLTSNTKVTKGLLKRAGFETIAVAKKRNVSISVKVGTEAREGDKTNLLRGLGELERPRGRLKAVTFPENWVKAVATEELQGTNWKKETEEGTTKALQWMDMPQTLMGVAPGDSEQRMVGAGMGEGTARKIREQTEQWMLEEYHRDATLKEQCCRKERGRRRRQENKMKKRRVTAERKRKQAIRGNTWTALKRRRREIADR